MGSKTCHAFSSSHRHETGNCGSQSSEVPLLQNFLVRFLKRLQVTVVMAGSTDSWTAMASYTRVCTVYKLLTGVFRTPAISYFYV